MNLKSDTIKLMHKAMDNNMAVTPILHQLSHYRYRDSILRWLILNRITGHNLVDWLKINHENSVLSMVQFIVKYKEKNGDILPLYLNKDWVK